MMKKQAVYFLSASTMLVSATSALAATKVGVVGAANPMLLAESEGGISRELHPGDVIFLNETIRTTESGSAQLMFLDRSSLTIAPASEVTIDKFVYNPISEEGEMKLSTAEGAFRFIGGALSKKKPVSFETPVSTMEIRGSIGDIKTTGTQSSGVFINGESMSMQTGNGPAITLDKPGAGIAVDGPNMPPRTMTSQQVKSQIQSSPIRTTMNSIQSNITNRVNSAINDLNQRMQGVRSTRRAQLSSPVTATRSVTVPEPDPIAESPAPETPPAEPNTQPAPENATQPVEGNSSNQSTPADESGTSSADNQTETATDTAQASRGPATSNPLPQNEVNEIRANPNSVLQKFPKGGPQMANYVSRAVATDPSLASGLADIANNGNPAQQSAMGAGMVRGTRMVNRIDPEAARQITNDALTSNAPNMRRTFKAIGPGVGDIGQFDAPSNINAPADSSRSKKVRRRVGSRSNSMKNNDGLQRRHTHRMRNSPLNAPETSNSDASQSQSRARVSSGQTANGLNNRLNAANTGGVFNQGVLSTPAIQATVTGVVAEDEITDRQINAITNIVVEDNLDNEAPPISPVEE